ncbi:hypothetical protein T439DRAFT_42812 [Meredithblackwellia eburnea MCA 4105]
MYVCNPRFGVVSFEHRGRQVLARTLGVWISTHPAQPQTGLYALSLSVRFATHQTGGRALHRMMTRQHVHSLSLFTIMIFLGERSLEDGWTLFFYIKKRTCWNLSSRAVKFSDRRPSRAPRQWRLELATPPWGLLPSLRVLSASLSRVSFNSDCMLLFSLPPTGMHQPSSVFKTGL